MAFLRNETSHERKEIIQEMKMCANSALLPGLRKHKVILRSKTNMSAKQLIPVD